MSSSSNLRARYPPSMAWQFLCDSNNVPSPKRASKASDGKENDTAPFADACANADVDAAACGDVDDPADEVDLRFLEQQLSLAGTAPPKDLSVLSRAPAVVECLHRLLRQRGRNLETIDELAQQSRRLQSEADSLRTERAALKERLQDREVELRAAGERAAAVAADTAAERRRLQAQRQELETRCGQLESRDTHHRAALRKKETEYARLQDGLRRNVAKDRSSARAIELRFPLSRAAGDRTVAAPPLLSSFMGEIAEGELSDLASENAALRDQLAELREAFGDVREWQARFEELAAPKNAESAAAAAAAAVPTEQLFGMPAEWLCRRLGAPMAAHVLALRGRIDQAFRDRGCSNGAEERREGVAGSDAAAAAAAAAAVAVAAAKAEAAEARELLEQQDEVLRALLFAEGGPTDSMRGTAAAGAGLATPGEGDRRQSMSSLWEDAEAVRGERSALALQRRELDRDRSQLAALALRYDLAGLRYDYNSAAASPLPPPPPRPAGQTPLRKMPAPSRTPAAATAAAAGRKDTLLGGISSPSPFSPLEASPATAQLLSGLGINLPSAASAATTAAARAEREADDGCCSPIATVAAAR